MKKAVVAVVSLALLGGAQAMARDINFGHGLTQGGFKSLSKEAGAAISYKKTSTAEPLGLTGFDIGVEASAADINSGSGYWKKAFDSNNPPSYLFLPKVRARKGLPFGIDVGAMYGQLPDSNIKLYGFEVSKAILEGGIAEPALGVRATYSRLAGVKDLDLQTAGVDATISKGFFIFTPYVGGGATYVNSKVPGSLQSTTTADSLPLLKSESFWQPRGFAGVKVSPFPLFGITGEVEYQVRPIYSLKAALSF